MEHEDTHYLYTGLDAFLAKHVSGKVQKISVNAGLTCPNRDGTLGYGGCTYCNNRTFNPDYCEKNEPIRIQLEKGKSFFAHKYPAMNYLAYFQAYTNTYGEAERLKGMYEEALSVDRVVGLVVATRPDCVSADWLDYFAELSRRTFVWIEYGIESVYNRTLQRINRGHDYAAACRAIEETARRGIPVGGHVILGLPGETHEELVREAGILSQLPIDTLKLHQLQVIRGTRMAMDYERDGKAFNLFSLDEYIDLVIDFLSRLRTGIALDRFVSQSPKSLLLAPAWGVKNHVFVDKLKKRMRERGEFQGRCYVRPATAPM